MPKPMPEVAPEKPVPMIEVAPAKPMPPVAPPAPPTPEERIKQLEKENAELRRQIVELQRALRLRKLDQ
jgi:hypothetical protein